MKELDDILNKHLPGASLCKRGKALNKQRIQAIKADILHLFRPNKYEKGKGGTVYTDTMAIIDEQQLGVTPSFSSGGVVYNPTAELGREEMGEKKEYVIPQHILDNMATYNPNWLRDHLEKLNTPPIPTAPIIPLTDDEKINVIVDFSTNRSKKPTRF